MIDQGIGSWIVRRRVKSRGHVALVSSVGELTYDELAERVGRLANALERRGIGPGSVVAFLGQNHPAFFEVLLATAQCGAVFVPINIRLAAPEIRFILTDCGADALISTTECDALGCEAAEGVELVLHATVRGPGSAAGAPEDYEGLFAGERAERAPKQIALDDPAVVLYTSGTTGRPKGAVLTHGNLTWNCLNVLVDYDVTSSDVALMIAPLFHAASLGMGALPCLMKGATLVLRDRFDPAGVLDDVEQHRITMLSGVPTTFQLIAEEPGFADADLSSLRTITCGGSAIPLRVIEAYEAKGLSFTGGYGMTEAAPGATSLQPEWTRHKVGSSGLPHFFSGIRIVDASGEPVPPGVVGEIQLTGPNVIAEYLHLPEASRDARDGAWFRSGDLGYLDEDGFLYVVDRSKDMIISGGENVYPAQIEALLMELTEVTSVAVIGVPDERWGEVPCAVITLANGAELTLERVVEHLNGRVARYKIPKSIVVVDEMPRTASGKIRKHDLRKELLGASA